MNEYELGISGCNEAELIRITATKLEVDRNMHRFLGECHNNLKNLENFIKVWCNEDISDDVVGIRRGLADLERKCEELIDKH